MIDWASVAPALVLACGAVAALLVDAFVPFRSWRLPAIAAGLGVVGGLVAVFWPDTYRGIVDPLTVVILLGTGLVIMTMAVMDHEYAMPPGELHFLLLSSAAGAVTIVVATDFVTLVVGLELLSLPSIAMVGLRRGDVRAARAAWTYFLVSAVATAITLMGVSLLYGVTGSLRYGDVAAALGSNAQLVRPEHAAVLLTLVGLLFKVGAVPFHSWIPDAYRGASVGVAAYLSVVSKAGAIGALVVVLGVAFAYERPYWAPVVAVVAALTLLVGNVGALAQRDGIGMLAWSSIGQSGFMLAPMVGVFGVEGFRAPVQYLAVYALATVVAFAAVAVVRRRWGGTSYAHLAGLIRRDPWMGTAMAFALLTLAGFPPAVIGLLTKYVVFRQAVRAEYGWLAVVMAICVAIALVYYLRLIVVIFSPRPPHERGDELSPSPPHAVKVVRTGVFIASGLLVVSSVAPDLVLRTLF